MFIGRHWCWVWRSWCHWVIILKNKESQKDFSFIPVPLIQDISKSFTGPFSDMGQRGIWRRLHEAPLPSQTKRWHLLWGGCRRRPGCRCHWLLGHVTTCAGPTSHPQMTEWHQNGLPECPEKERTKNSECWQISLLCFNMKYYLQ